MSTSTRLAAAQAHPLRTGWSLWSRFWFDPIPAARVGLLRFWLFGFVFFDVLFRKEAWVGLADTPRLFWDPAGATWLLDRVGVGPPNAWQIVFVQVVLPTAALLAAVGYRYRAVGPIAAVLYCYWQCLGQSWGEMKHARVTLILALLFLCVVSAQQSRSLDSLRARLRTAGREVRVVDRAPVDAPSRDAAWAVRAIRDKGSSGDATAATDPVRRRRHRQLRILLTSLSHKSLRRPLTQLRWVFPRCWHLSTLSWNRSLPQTRGGSLLGATLVVVIGRGRIPHSRRGVGCP